MDGVKNKRLNFFLVLVSYILRIRVLGDLVFR